jgi:hypothetical protein
MSPLSRILQIFWKELYFKCTIVTSNLPVTRFLIDLGADTTALVKGTYTLLGLALRANGLLGNTYKIIVSLLNAGASANHPEAAKTPLQVWAETVAEGMLEIDLVENFLDVLDPLLEAGADINGTGNDEAVIVKTYENRRKEEGDGRNTSVYEKIQERGALSNYDTPL